MPRPRPPYLLKEASRHGRTLWYVRKGDGPRVRIHGEFGTDEFMAAYHVAVRDGQPIARTAPKPRTGSLRWLWTRYRETAAWAELSDATRGQRENIMLHVLEGAGDEPFGDIDRQTIEQGKDRRAATPAQARNFLDMMRGLFRWAKEAEHVEVDPTEGVKNPKRKKGKGFPEWTEEDVIAYQETWPLGTKEHVWLALLLYTGPRRGDASRLGKQHARAIWDRQAKKNVRVLSFRTEKGGEQLEVTIPILPILQKALDAGPTGDLNFIVGKNGKPLTKESFGNAFSAAARKAGVYKSAHGVRKIAAITAATNGATVHQLMSIFGWKTVAMAEHYTREANRRHLALQGMHTLGNRTPEQLSIPAPKGKVRG